MPLAIPPGFAHVAVQMRHENDPEPWYVTYGIGVSNFGGNFEAIAQRCRRAMADAWEQAFSPQVSFSGVQLTVGQDGGEPIRMFVAPSNERKGTSSSEMLPQNCALLVRKNTNLGGRRNRGRCFLPGCIGEGHVSATGVLNGNIIGAYQGYAQTWFGYHSDPVDADEATPMVILHSTGNTAIPEPTPVTSLTVDNVISTQRRRLR